MKRWLALAAIVLICFAGCAPNSPAPGQIQACDTTRRCGEPAADALIGRHVWARGLTSMCPRLSDVGLGLVTCSGYESINAGVGATVIGFAATNLNGPYVHIRLDDGRTGFIRASEAAEFETDERHAEKLAKTHADEEVRQRQLAEIDAQQKKDRAEIAAKHAQIDRCISGLDKLHIGMTEQEAKSIAACVPLHKVNTTETVGGMGKQVVLYFNETWANRLSLF
jgi:hypothetical protein